MKLKEQIELENIYLNLNNKNVEKNNLNEGISGIYPEEANNLGAMVAHILFFIVPYIMYKLKQSTDEGTIRSVIDIIKKNVIENTSELTLKEKISLAVNNFFSKAKNLIPVQNLIPSDLEDKTIEQIDQEMKRKEMGIKNYNIRSSFRG